MKQRTCPVCGTDDQDEIHAVLNGYHRDQRGRTNIAGLWCDKCDSKWEAMEPTYDAPDENFNIHPHYFARE